MQREVTRGAALVQFLPVNQPDLKHSRSFGSGDMGRKSVIGSPTMATRLKLCFGAYLPQPQAGTRSSC